MRRLACILGLGALWTVTALAFANVPVGATIENVSLPSLAGGEEMLLSETNVSLFIFIDPELDHSNHALSQISICAQSMTNKPIHWCAVVSDRIARTNVEAQVRACGWKWPVLIDRGDALYGRLGVFLHPVVGVTDEHRTLVAYEHFTKVNFAAVVQAQVRHALKEISDEELALVLHPPAATFDKDESVAHRQFRLAEKQFANTNYAQALVNVQKSLARKPTAEAHALRGKILAAQGNTNEANAAFETARKLESPTDSSALAPDTKR